MIQKLRGIIRRIKREPEPEEISEEWKQLLEDMPISMGDLLYLTMRESMADTYANYADPEKQKETKDSLEYVAEVYTKYAYSEKQQKTEKSLKKMEEQVS